MQHWGPSPRLLADPKAVPAPSRSQQPPARTPGVSCSPTAREMPAPCRQGGKSEGRTHTPAPACTASTPPRGAQS